MSASAQSRTATRGLDRVLGPFLVIVDIAAIMRASEMQALVADFEANSLWSWVIGAFILLFGLIMVAGHQYWRGAAAITVSVLGWLVALRGLLLLAFPQVLVSLADNMIQVKASCNRLACTSRPARTYNTLRITTKMIFAAVHGSRVRERLIRFRAWFAWSRRHSAPA